MKRRRCGLAKGYKPLECPNVRLLNGFPVHVQHHQRTDAAEVRVDATAIGDRVSEA